MSIGREAGREGEHWGVLRTGMPVLWSHEVTVANKGRFLSFNIVVFLYEMCSRCANMAHKLVGLS